MILKELEGELASGYGGIIFLMPMLERSGEWATLAPGRARLKETGYWVMDLDTTIKTL